MEKYTPYNPQFIVDTGSDQNSAFRQAYNEMTGWLAAYHPEIADDMLKIRELIYCNTTYHY